MAIENYSLSGKTFALETKPGVFAQYGLDKGSKVLLGTLPLPLDGNVLDLGCGCGFLGIVTAGLSGKSKVYMVDSDLRAINLSKENIRRNSIPNAEAILSDGISSLSENLKFDSVISNPPTHQGREVLVQFIQEAYRILNIGGSAYFVVNRMSSVLDRMNEVFGNSEKVAKKDGFIVFRSTKTG